MEAVDIEKDAIKRRSDLYDKYKKYFDLQDKIEDFRHKILENNNPIFSNEDVYKNVIWFLTGKSSKTFRAIRILCSLGYGEDAAILLRSLFENLLYILFISKGEKEKLALEYIEYDFIIKKEGLDRLKKYPNDYIKYKKEIDRQELEIINNYNNFLQKYSYKNKRNIFNKDKRMLAKEVGLEWEYDMVYWLDSHYAHTTPNTANKMIKFEENIYSASSGPSDNFVLQNIVSSLYYILMILEKVIEVFSINEKDNLGKIINDFKELSNTDDQTHLN